MIKKTFLLICVFISGCTTLNSSKKDIFMTMHEVKQGYYNEFLLHVYDDDVILQQKITVNKLNQGKWTPSLAHRLYNADLSSFIEFRVSFSEDQTSSSYKYYTKGVDGKYKLQIKEYYGLQDLSDVFDVMIIKDKGSVTYSINGESIMSGPKLHDIKFVGTLYVSMDVDFETVQD